jgi:hypothetical protein
LRLHKGDINAVEAAAPRAADPIPAVNAAIPARQAGGRSRRARTRRRYQIPRGIGRSINPARAAAPHRSSPPRRIDPSAGIGCSDACGSMYMY